MQGVGEGQVSVQVTGGQVGVSDFEMTGELVHGMGLEI